MLQVFQTDRLSAERLRTDHLDELDRMHQDPKVMATLGGVRTPEQTRQILRVNLEHWDRHGYGLWVFRNRSDSRFVGRGGLRHVHVGGVDEVELAYALMAEDWGRGLATEMAEAILTLAFGDLGLPDVVCFTLPTNVASRRVMEKVGFLFEREVIHVQLTHVLYRIASPGGRSPRAPSA